MEYNCNSYEVIESSRARDFFKELYGYDEGIIEHQITRYRNLIKSFMLNFNSTEFQIFSSPGRTEIAGNHTDHNNGKVLAGSINLDCIGIAVKTNNNKITLIDQTYNEQFIVDLENHQKIDGETGAIALVRGIISAFMKFGFTVGGFNISVTSDVISAAGISSSASFEMLICTVINSLYNDNKIDKKTLGIIGQYAENIYWGKASGLLDQMACIYGGMISIDFVDPLNPAIKEIDFDFSSKNYRLLIVNTGGNHADLSEQYSAIPYEMKEVSAHFNKAVCRDVTLGELLKNISNIRNETGDRAVLRALHFILENIRVDNIVEALHNDEFDKFLNIVTDSGSSSWKWLQNCYVTENPRVQPIPLALALTETFIRNSGCKAGFRVHGGGFAGVIMTILPDNFVEQYTSLMQTVFGNRAVYNLSIRKYGAINVTSHIS